MAFDELVIYGKGVIFVIQYKIIICVYIRGPELGTGDTKSSKTGTLSPAERTARSVCGKGTYPKYWDNWNTEESS